MASINPVLNQEENIFALLVESNAGFEPYVDGLGQGVPAANDPGATRNTRIAITALAGSGLQEGSTFDYNYNRLDLADDATIGSFTGVLYVPEGGTEEQIRDMVAEQAGLVREALAFADYIAIDKDTDGAITVNPIANCKLYVGTTNVVLRRYVPTVQDIGPQSELNGFTSPVDPNAP